MTNEDLRAWMRAEAADPPTAELRERVLTVPASSTPEPVSGTGISWFRPLALAEAAVIALLAVSIGFVFFSQRPDDQGAVVPGAVETEGGRASPSETTAPKENEMKIRSTVVAATATAALAVTPVAGQELESTEFEGKLHYRNTELYEDGTYFFGYRVDEVSDPRLDGEVVLAVRPTYLGNLEQLWYGSFRVENEHGAWQAEPHLILEFTDHSASAATSAFIGEGDYAGLTAFVELDYIPEGEFGFRGVIVDAPLPEPPLLHAEADGLLTDD